MIARVSSLAGLAEVVKKISSGKKVIFSLPNYDYESHVRFFTSYQEIEDRYKEYLHFYHHDRIHESLNDQTPASIVGYNINYQQSPICM